LTVGIDISPGVKFSLPGPDNISTVDYEIFRAPGDFASNIIIPAGKRGVIAYGIEGKFSSPISLISAGGPNQSFSIKGTNILEAPITVDVYTGAESQSWVVTTEPLELYNATDNVVNVAVYSDRMDLLFGDDINGKAPLAGQAITVRYRIGGGIRGRINSYAINDSRSFSPQISGVTGAPVQITFRNIEPSYGGTDRESLEQAKKRAPRDFAVRAFASDRPASIVTSSDYAQFVSAFTSPVYGSVAKAVASIRTGKNANLVELYILAYGPNGLVTPSVGLKQAIETYVSQYNVLTDVVSVLDGAIKSVDIDMTVVVSRNADASIIRTKVNSTLNSFFDVANRELGQPLYFSDVQGVISKIDGVSYVDLFKPVNNILPTMALASPMSEGVGINEIILDGTRTIKIFYEKSSRA
jgi:hypothetical protein